MLQRMNQLTGPTLSLTLATLLLPQAEQAAASAQLAGVLGRRLRFTNKEIERTAWLLDHVNDLAAAADLPWPRLQRLLIHDGAGELVALREAIAGAGDASAAFCRARLAWPPERLNPPPLLDGGALIAHGLAPGPHFAPLLEKIRDAQLNGEIHSRAEALALVDRLR
jgi:hypothetical protein